MQPSRIVLIHWNAQEAEPRLEQLRRGGFNPEWVAPHGGAGVQRFDRDPPDAFVIDLSRAPSQGQAVGVFLRQRKATRGVPLVFAGGQPDKVERLRQLLPDAVYTDWDHAVGEIRAARPPASPVTPNTMAGYSGVPLVKKLGIKSGVLLLGAPKGFAEKLGPFKRARTAHRVLLFVRSIADMKKRFPQAAARVAEHGGLWIVWPKKASGVASDLSEAAVREFGLSSAWVDYKICAVDETWSGLLFARRK